MEVGVPQHFATTHKMVPRGFQSEEGMVVVLKEETVLLNGGWAELYVYCYTRLVVLA